MTIRDWAQRVLLSLSTLSVPSQTRGNDAVAWLPREGDEDGATMAWDSDWPARAACRMSDPDALFVQGAAQNRAKGVCVGCPVRTECLADALDNRVEFGVWGGMTERERRALLRRRPNVSSWRDLLEMARNSYERRVVAQGTDQPLRAAG